MGSSTRLSGVSAEVVTWEGNLDEPIIAAWRDLVRRDDQSQVFAFPEWVATAYRVGITSPWRVVLITQDTHPIAIFPLHCEQLWTASGLSLLAPDHASAVIDPQAEEAAFTGLMRWFAAQWNVGVLKLGPCGNSRHRELFHFACASHGLVSRDHESTSTVWIDLPSSWDAYLSELGAATRKSVKTAEKRLLRDFPDLQFSMLICPSSESDAALDALMQLYRLRWAQQVGGSLFHHTKNVEFYHQMVTWALGEGLAAVPVLRIDGKVIAVSTIFRLPQRPSAIFHMIARDTERLSGYYAPGIFLNMQSIQWAIEQGIRTINIGSGKNEHKVLLGGREESIWELSAARSEFILKVVPRIERGLHVTGRAPLHLWHHLRSCLARQRGRE